MAITEISLSLLCVACMTIYVCICVFRIMQVSMYGPSLAGQTLSCGESLVKFPSGFGVAYSAAGYLMK